MKKITLLVCILTETCSIHGASRIPQEDTKNTLIEEALSSFVVLDSVFTLALPFLALGSAAAIYVHREYRQKQSLNVTLLLRDDLTKQLALYSESKRLLITQQEHFQKELATAHQAQQHLQQQLERKQRQLEEKQASWNRHHKALQKLARHYARLKHRYHLKVEQLNEALGTPQACCLCLQNYNPIHLPCGHYFHEQCNDLWENQCKQTGLAASCPLCRASVNEEEIEAVEHEA